jgi:acetylglutamate kinase
MAICRCSPRRPPSDQGEAINVDGDRAAAMVAAAFNAEALVILSNVPGLLRNFPDEASLITRDSHEPKPTTLCNLPKGV